MRTANFRDDVLWPIAYQLGLTPETDFLKDQAASLASYINAWVRRLWDAADWPEWTVVGRFSVSASHIVNYNQTPIEYVPPPLDSEAPDAPPPGNAVKPMLGKVLRLYLVDPRATWTPVDTPFRLTDHGVHCGFDHGNAVWIKYVTRAPKFTTTEWDTNVTYKKDALIYSPASGDCYVSKASGNHGHDPTELSDSQQRVVLTTEIIQQFEPRTATSPAVPKQIKLSISDNQVLPLETYTLTFIGLDGAEHRVSYMSLSTDGAEQILLGLSDAIGGVVTDAPSSPDAIFFAQIIVALDESPALIFEIATMLAKVSLDAEISVPNSLWWTFIPFPLALVDQVVRGAYADALKEEGQPDKGGPEEQQVPNEQSIRSGAFASKQFDGLTDQQIQRSRYGK